MALGDADCATTQSFRLLSHAQEEGRHGGAPRSMGRAASSRTRRLGRFWKSGAASDRCCGRGTGKAAGFRKRQAEGRRGRAMARSC